MKLGWIVRGATLVAPLSTAACVDPTLAARTAFVAALNGGGPSNFADAGLAAETVRVWTPVAGFVRGTREAIATWGTPLKAAAGMNHTVEACRVTMWGEAEKLGARSIEAVSAGPHRRNRNRERVAPVRMRIIYPRPDGAEVKVATMTCVMNREGRIVNAFMRR